jgi:D-sedoheptulose 7-phosphate isomerase
MLEQKLNDIINKTILTKEKCLEVNRKAILQGVELIERTFRENNKILICGNGGSAADSQHIAAEFVSRYLIERPALFAIALNSNTSTLTAIGNDYGYDFVFSRQVEAFGAKGDILWAISTSGNSKNVIRAVEVAKKRGMFIIGMTGEGGGQLGKLCDVLLSVPSKHTPNIQECHITIGHIICEIVESNLFSTADTVS